MTTLSDLRPILPELVLAVFGMILLVYGVFSREDASRRVSLLAVLTFAVAAFCLMPTAGKPVIAFHGQFIVDGFGGFMKLLVLIGAAFSVVISLRFNEREGIARFEYPVLIVFATLGMLMMISANDLLSLYVGLELQSLSLYVIAAFQRDSTRSSEAGLKYFVLGALSSGLLLYGASLVYGFAGTTNFEKLASVLAGEGGTNVGLTVGLVMMLSALAFKISAVPFHMWTPDVYEGAPTPVTAFFSVAPKIAALALLIRVLIEPFGNLDVQWQQIIILISILSMVLGSFAAIRQTNIKRLMAYSSIGHVGYALVGLAANSSEGVRGIAVYLAIYLAMNIGTFCCILTMRRQGRMVEDIDELAGLSRTNPLLALVMTVFMFSMAGIPPLAGFFGKLYVFLAAINSGLYMLAVIGVLTSVVGAYYYLRIVKLMYFDEPVEHFERPLGREINFVLAVTGLFTMLFFLFPSVLVDHAQAAAASLFGG